MNKTHAKLGLVIVGLIIFNALFGQVNMDRYITLGIKKGEEIQLNIAGDMINTKIKILSGSLDAIITVADSLTTFAKYLSDSAIMTIYGDVKYLDCSANTNKIIRLDASKNKELKELLCNDNNIMTIKLTGLTAIERIECNNNNLLWLDVSGLSSLKKISIYDNKMLSWSALDNIYCELPRRIESDSAFICPVKGIASSNHDSVLKSNANNAILKHWRVKYYYDTDLSTLGNHSCLSNGIENICSNSYKIYPNPAVNRLQIEAVKLIKRIKVYDVAGKLIINKQNIDNNTNIQTIDISNLLNGLYMLHIQSEDDTKVYKFTKVSN